MKMAFLEYMFIFDTAEAWQHLYQFEDDLAKFFKERGFEATIVKTIEGQASGRRILAIKRVDVLAKENKQSNKSPKEQIIALGRKGK